MFGTIVRKEILENISSFRFHVIMIFSSLLIIFSVYTGIESYQGRLGEHNLAVQRHEDSLENHPNWIMLASMGYNVDKPPSRLSTVAEGVEGILGRTAKIDAVSPVKLEESKYSDNPLLAMFGSFDLMFVVRAVLSLFAILFSYDVISGERERGTLKLMLANSVPRDMVILGKAVGSFLCLAIPLTIPLLIGMIMMGLSPSVTMNTDTWLRLMGVMLTFFLYLGCFFALGLLVSACTHRASASFMILLFIWIVSVFVIPRASIVVANRLSPAMSLQELHALKDANMQDMIAGLRYEEMMSKNDKLDAEYARQIQSQISLAANLSRISPAACMTYAALALTDTGIRRHERFLATARSYKPKFMEVVGAMMEDVDFSRMFTQPKKPNTNLIPRFEFHEERLSDSLSRSKVDYIVISILTVIFFIGAHMAFLRYNVSR